MKKDYAKKGLVIGIIFLFIGVGVYPAIAVKLNTSSTNTIDKVENKNISINDISNFNLNKLNLLMFLSMKPKLFTSMIKSYSKTSDNLCKLSSKDCLKIVDKMVKEKLTMTLNALKIIKSKNLIDSSKTKLNYEDIHLKISEISNKYNESFSAFETQDFPLIICIFIEVAFEAAAFTLGVIWAFMSEHKNNSIIYWGLMPIVISIYGLCGILLSLEIYYDCFPYPPEH
jgi:hypothetical protein